MKSLYSRVSSAGGTYVPGVHKQASDASDSQNNSSNNANPVVGFLYSISRQGIGEFWPLHIGKNRIGRADDNDVVLKEKTVSEYHATLNVRKMASNKIIASVQDEGSKTGMYLNDEELDFEKHNCANGDLLTIGKSYQLVVVLIDADAYGLTVAENFMPAEELPQAGGNAAADDDFDEGLYRNRHADGTINLSGNSQEDGGTKNMFTF
ncbi:MAG: FHA domain-containing protein [Bacteroidales bacterium]|nr:FHA domain-containing protein [Bacteroidales bacterium]